MNLVASLAIVDEALLVRADSDHLAAIGSNAHAVDIAGVVLHETSMSKHESTKSRTEKPFAP